ncbi:hypothetical protein GS438_00640 [Rhodococcus hoagii]|nr:hypothetical protein [Prescottella equi]
MRGRLDRQNRRGLEQHRGVRIVPAGVTHPVDVDAYGAPVVSVNGSASRSARNARQVAVSGPTSHHNPVPLGSSTGSSPTRRSWSWTSSVVRNSSKDSSGWACRSRRQATSRS